MSLRLFYGGSCPFWERGAENARSEAAVESESQWESRLQTH